jgi:serine/threonine protein kinase
MALEKHTRLGNYEIQGILGAGGMGEVYRAHDTKLDRDVAIKVLPRKFAEDTQALERFEREAKAVAALAHPNILAIYDFGNVEGAPYAVMELLHGQTLREHLRDGALPPRKAASLARQMAEGLGAAHDKGIVHRDLKPDNVFITTDGRPKILDFGLAADARIAGLDSVADETAGPTVGKALTEPGTVLGTVGYMAPEQIRAESVDHRADIFAFGCLLYEMLGGQRAFKRNTAVETMAAVLREEPDRLDSISSSVSPALDRVVRRCLEKNPEERFQSTRDLAFAIDNAASASDSGWFGNSLSDAGGADLRATGNQSARRQRQPVWLWVLTAVVAAAAGLGAGFVLSRSDSALPSSSEPPRTRTLTVSGQDLEPSASPDGHLVAFRSNRSGQPRIWLKQLAGGGEEPLTDGPDERPKFSPDGSTLLFIREESDVRSLYRQSLLGGQARKLLDDVADAAWSPDGRQLAIVRVAGLAGDRSSRIGIVDVDGSNVVFVYEVAKILGGVIWSPDGKYIVAVQAALTGNSRDCSLVFIDAVTKEVRHTHPTDTGLLMSGLTWTASGELVLAIASSVIGDQGDTASRYVRFNLDSGKATTLFWAQHLFPLQGLRFDATIADIVASGTIVYHTTSIRQGLREFALDESLAAADGRVLARSQGRDRQPTYAPDGRSAIFSSNRSGNLDLWRIDLQTSQVQQLTDDAAQDWDPGFSRDGRQIAWSSDRGGHLEIWIANAEGSGARQLTNDGVDAENPTFTPDGEWVVFWSSNPEKVGIWKIRTDGTDVQQLTAGAYLQPEVSPDGKYAAYLFLEFDKLRTIIHVLDIATATVLPFQIVVPAPSSGTDIILGRLRWLPDGSGLAYVGVDDNDITGIYAQDFVPDGDTHHSKRQLVGFTHDYMSESFAISPDGKRLLLSTLEGISNLMLVDGLQGVEPPR